MFKGSVMADDLPVLTDDDIRGILEEDSTIESVVSEVEEFFRDRKKGKVVSPPRFVCETAEGNIVFTSGASERKGIAGFRAYTTFGASGMEAQITAVYTTEGYLKCIFIGELVGRLRTAAINAVAIKHLSRHDSRVLGIIGSGKQARSGVPVIARVRDFESVLVYSLNPDNAKRFAEDMRETLSRTGAEVSAAESAREVVARSDVVLAATRASRPVISSDWLREGLHITSMGQKFRESHEIDPSIVEIADIAVTDSLQQLRSYGSTFFVGESTREKITELSDHIDGGGREDNDISLFLSAGLAGTEVVVADLLLEEIRRSGAREEEAK